jgi:hypothetical protein
MLRPSLPDTLHVCVLNEGTWVRMDKPVLVKGDFLASVGKRPSKSAIQRTVSMEWRQDWARADGLRGMSLDRW